MTLVCITVQITTRKNKSPRSRSSSVQDLLLSCLYAIWMPSALFEHLEDTVKMEAAQVAMSRPAAYACSINVPLWMSLSAGLWSRVFWKVYTDVPEESSALIIYLDDGGRRFLRNASTYFRLHVIFSHTSLGSQVPTNSWFLASCVYTVIVILCDWTMSFARVYIIRSARPLCMTRWSEQCQPAAKYGSLCVNHPGWITDSE